MPTSTERYRLQETARRIDQDHIMIPDISFLTSVPLPELLDLKDTSSIVALLSAFTVEEQCRNRRYLGMYLLGSIAEGTAVGGSDIDVLHITQPRIDKAPYTITRGISYRLKAVIEFCYSRKLDECQGLDIGIARSWLPRVQRLNRYSIPIGLPDRVVAAIKAKTSYHERGKYLEVRPFKSPSIDIDPARFSYPSNNTFTWLAEYGLLNPIER